MSETLLQKIEKAEAVERELIGAIRLLSYRDQVEMLEQIRDGYNGGGALTPFTLSSGASPPAGESQ